MLGLKDTSALCRWEKGVSLPDIMHLLRLFRIYKALPTEMYLDFKRFFTGMVCCEALGLVSDKEQSREKSNYSSKNFSICIEQIR